MITELRPTFLDVIALEEITPDEYIAPCTAPCEPSTYGGQIAAQCLVAAGNTLVDEKSPHSIHMYFMRPGSPREPMRYRVTRDRDGRSYSTRHVVAEQGGRAVSRAIASFHVGEHSQDVQIPVMPPADAPEKMEQAGWIRAFSTDMRRRVGRDEPQHPLEYWARCLVPLGDSPLLNAAALAYMSDMSTGLSKFSPSAQHQMSSIDHSVWFHRPALLEGWTLFSLRPESIACGRGLYSGSAFNATGSLVATFAQESLFRLPTSVPVQPQKEMEQHEPS
jgi:acyl-CoA thioesterase-2